MRKSTLYLIVSTITLLFILSGILFFVKSDTKTGTSNSELVIVNQTGSLESVENFSGGITTSALAMHNSESDCWVGFKGKAYDVTDYLSRHPGGKRTITPYCGTSSGFEKAFSGYHGSSQTSTLIRASTLKGNLI